MKKNLVQYIKEIRDKMENLEESQKSYTDEKTLIAFRGENCYETEDQRMEDTVKGGSLIKRYWEHDKQSSARMD